MGIANDTYAKLTRDQYDDWLERFYPSQQELLQTTQNTDLLNSQIVNAGTNIESAAAAAQTANKNQLARYGLTDPGQGVNQAQTQLAKVSSANSLREYESDRSLSTLTGANSSLSLKKSES